MIKKDSKLYLEVFPIDIRHLEYFVEVARQKSFSKAAIISHVSQSAISKMIKNLETELGTSLFNRTSKYVQLTDTGIIFLDQAQLDSLTSKGTKMAPNAHIKGYRQRYPFRFTLTSMVTIYKIWICEVQPVHRTCTK